ncbi:Hsp20/alpha crystallin family protein [Massilia sp. DJPM01]|uniref:Hsp20/alpha crystallin family protein n=1 Tax=Massilia sp. DJPM01 TaxID=3024404 RepID=UPI00259EAB76|nr:Hsp20/alpha crystallin family protein [Massilia sp. DJPM01]MDM5179286.1 Hsp20/alpha crystallin family protein [Massilia sp. DJPM01]
MTTRENEHGGTAGAGGQAGNPAPMGDPADAGIAGSTGGIGNAGADGSGTSGAGGEAGGEAMSGSGVGGGAAGGSASTGSGQGNAAMADGTRSGQGAAAMEDGNASAQGSAGAGAGALAQSPSTGQTGGTALARSGVLIPPVDVIEDANGITLLADIPGVSRDQLDLRLETNSLTINGSVSLDVPPEMESRYAEVKHQHYQRSFALSRELDGEQASAELNHGVLKIRIPKAAHAQPRRVQIKVA